MSCCVCVHVCVCVVYEPLQVSCGNAGIPGGWIMQPGLCGSGLGQISGNRTKAVSVCIFVRVVYVCVCVCVCGVDPCGSLQKQSMYSTPCIYLRAVCKKKSQNVLCQMHRFTFFQTDSMPVIFCSHCWSPSRTSWRPQHHGSSTRDLSLKPLVRDVRCVWKCEFVEIIHWRHVFEHV